MNHTVTERCGATRGEKRGASAQQRFRVPRLETTGTAKTLETAFVPIVPKVPIVPNPPVPAKLVRGDHSVIIIF